MGGLPLRPKSNTVGTSGRTEMPHPDVIHRHARGQRVIVDVHPAGQGRAAAGARRGIDVAEAFVRLAELPNAAWADSWELRAASVSFRVSALSFRGFIAGGFSCGSRSSRATSRIGALGSGDALGAARLDGQLMPRRWRGGAEKAAFRRRSLPALDQLSRPPPAVEFGQRRLALAIRHRGVAASLASAAGLGLRAGNRRRYRVASRLLPMRSPWADAGASCCTKGRRPG